MNTRGCAGSRSDNPPLAGAGEVASAPLRRRVAPTRGRARAVGVHDFRDIASRPPGFASRIEQAVVEEPSQALHLAVPIFALVCPRLGLRQLHAHDRRQASRTSSSAICSCGLAVLVLRAVSGERALQRVRKPIRCEPPSTV